MAPAPLSPLPEGDGRPDPLADAVIARSVEAHIPALLDWLRPRVPALEPHEICAGVIAAVRRSGADGFRAACHLKNENSWPADMGLCLILRDITHHLDFALRQVTSEWVMRTGYRFPAKDREQIEWIDGAGRKRMGEVVAVDRSLAAGVVQPVEGLLKAGDPRRVLAEQVITNLTTGKAPTGRVPRQRKAILDA
ncbi:hypothetical protein KIKIMORA_05220 [Brevundimonas phage vB_BpoS-Kikimora]|uniref:Uncharacterized protein n=1 Tax=Brevundimonas phage vB_BpoS-Kikimora TaxID=2948601 RepID=A0A9E7SL57_9CAUD|nr:hypothetical protein KIKIMORA_05220 [Brevundimonas phage vB_BpoS-Kikimora]